MSSFAISPLLLPAAIRRRIPEGVRQVIGRRLSRLSEAANRLLTAASGFNGPFRADLAAAAAGLDEPDALDAIDAALEVQLVQPAGDAESYDFAHALIRHTLYAELSPSRQVRLHRGIAEAMERLYGGRALEHAAELAFQYHLSAGLPGTERGADYALAAGGPGGVGPCLGRGRRVLAGWRCTCSPRRTRAGLTRPAGWA
jgi:predicted ATPase